MSLVRELLLPVLGYSWMYSCRSKFVSAERLAQVLLLTAGSAGGACCHTAMNFPKTRNKHFNYVGNDS